MSEPHSESNYAAEGAAVSPAAPAPAVRFVCRSLGAAAEVSSGGGRRGLWREIIVVLGSVSVLAGVVYFAIGGIVEWALPHISAETEQRWFATFDPPLLRVFESKGDARLAHVESVLRKLAAHPDVPELPYRVLLVPGTEPNAFALPGGAIAVSAGLLDLLRDDEIALAFVLAHELGHFAQRDHLRGLGRQVGRGLAWSLIFGDGGDVLSGQAADLLDRRYSRGREAGADRFGVRLVHAAYGTTNGTDRLFAWLEERERAPEWTAMLSTHPAPGDRVRALRDFAATLERAQP